MTTTEIINACRRKILEETTDLVTDTTLLLYANQSYDDLKLRTFTNDQIQTATVTLTNGVGTLPTDFGTLYGPGYVSTTDKTPYNEKTIADFDRDSVEEAITVEGGTLKVNPSTTASIIIKYYPSYDALTTVQNPELNSYLHEPIVYGTIYRAYEDLQNEALSAYYRSLYEDEIKRRTGILSNYEEDNVKGGVMFNEQRLI